MAKPDRHPDGTPRIPKQMCLECGYVLDAASPAHGAPDMPSPGDVHLCLNCGKLMLFDELLRPREPTPAEWMEPQLIDLQARARAAVRRSRYSRPLSDKKGGRA